MNTDSDTMPEIKTREFKGKDGLIPVYIYLRVSTQMQDFERQKKIIEEYCSKELGKGYWVKEEFIEKVSGADANRPKYKEMWGKLQSRQAKVVITSSMDRFGRKLSELLKATEKAKKLDVELRFIKDRIIINNEESFTQTLIMQLLGAVAEFESNIASERVKQKVSILRENPFWWTGQKPKISGELWQDMVDMYYAKKPRSMGLVAGKYRRKPDPKQLVHSYTIEDIATHFNMSKGAFSDVVSRYVSAGIMTHRTPKKARKVEPISYLSLPSYLTGPKQKKGSHSILHPHYWPQNIRTEVAKKFGNYETLTKSKDRTKQKEAWQFGKKVYFGWMKEFVKGAIENADIFASHKDLMSGGDFGDLVDMRARMSQVELSKLSVDELADRSTETKN